MDNKKQVTHNPDVLCCLANLSNDEVFTPPQLANELLDLLPKEIWSDPTITFLDPCCKTGVFLREITLRLIEGLKDEIPDLQERINHILTKQVFGIAITELTALMTRRTLYCSKEANGKYSVCTEFGHSGGNIYYNPNIKHKWENGICKECGASQKKWSREELESHAYAFIHKPTKELFNMKFDVIIGNPPYQLSVGGGNGKNAIPIYDKFINQAKKLNPRYISMIIPSKWYTGGRNLDDFRATMIADTRIKELHDFANQFDCFSGVDVGGGICYFLWDSNYNGPCLFSEHKGEHIVNKSVRYLKTNYFNGVLRNSQAIPILEKLDLNNNPRFSSIVYSQTPFGIKSNFKDFKYSQESDLIPLLRVKKNHEKDAFVSKYHISKNTHLIEKYKVYTNLNYGRSLEGAPPYKVISNPILGHKNTCCTQSFLVIGEFDSEIYALNTISYMNTKFFRFLVMLSVAGATFSPNTYSLVPLQDFSKPWTDQELYEKYGLTQDEIDYIESMIRPMDNKED